eukprot:m.15470 g.15470  ORF g.15470 m.15470 type:complete len:71 (-) comp4482_c0_seq1:2876-3088(-)
MGNAVVCKVRSMMGANDELNSEFERTMMEYQKTCQSKAIEDMKSTGYEVKEQDTKTRVKSDLKNIKECLA